MNNTYTGQGNEAIIVERTYPVPVEKVWSALTSKAEMSKWYFDVSDFVAEPGYEFSFTGQNEGIVFLHLCKITEVVPMQKLAYTWRYEGYEGNSLVTFELFAQGANTRVRLTHEGLGSFPRSKDFARDNFVEGWTYILGTSLHSYLTGGRLAE